MDLGLLGLLGFSVFCLDYEVRSVVVLYGTVRSKFQVPGPPEHSRFWSSVIQWENKQQPLASFPVWDWGTGYLSL